MSGLGGVLERVRVDRDGRFVVALVLLLGGLQQERGSDDGRGTREGTDAEPEQLVLVVVPPGAGTGLDDDLGLDGLGLGLLHIGVLGHDRPPFSVGVIISVVNPANS